jgi:di/tripeptidase
MAEQVGEITYENFNALRPLTYPSKGIISIPVTQKGKMRYALLIAMEFNSMLPCAEIPWRNPRSMKGFTI